MSNYKRLSETEINEGLALARTKMGYGLYDAIHYDELVRGYQQYLGLLEAREAYNAFMIAIGRAQ